MNLPTYNLASLLDFYTRQNFELLRDFQKAETPLLNFKFFETTFTEAGTKVLFKHNLNFTPKDVIQTSIIGPTSGFTFTWNYREFDATNLSATITGTVTPTDPLIVRYLLGAK